MAATQSRGAALTKFEKSQRFMLTNIYSTTVLISALLECGYLSRAAFINFGGIPLGDIDMIDWFFKNGICIVKIM